MPFIFRRVYLLTRSDWLDFRALAMGVHSPPGEEKTFTFLTTSEAPGHSGHQVVGEVTRDEEDIIEVTEESGAVWRFDVLTREMWVNMPRKLEHEQRHVEVMAAFFQNDTALHDFLLDEYVGDNIPPSALV